jgi:hypothetical protein
MCKYYQRIKDSTNSELEKREIVILMFDSFRKAPLIDPSMRPIDTTTATVIHKKSPRTIVQTTPGVIVGGLMPNQSLKRTNTGQTLADEPS